MGFLLIQKKYNVENYLVLINKHEILSMIMK